MCGRFALKTSPEELARLFQLPDIPLIKPRYNVSPRQQIAAVRRNETSGERELASLLWWLIPSWSKTADIKYPTFNAVSETAAEKPSFRTPFKKGRRCLIPIDGFYEWKGDKGQKQPYFFHMRDKSPFALAGIWDVWQGEGQTIESCSVLTTEANDLVRPIHTKNRMPVILDPVSYDAWLNPTTKLAEIQALCRAYPPEKMDVFAVSKLVNSVKNESPECMDPANVA